LSERNKKKSGLSEEQGKNVFFRNCKNAMEYFESGVTFTKGDGFFSQVVSVDTGTRFVLY
jgi:hypothetical protein